MGEIDQLNLKNKNLVATRFKKFIVKIVDNDRNKGKNNYDL